MQTKQPHRSGLALLAVLAVAYIVCLAACAEKFDTPAASSDAGREVPLVRNYSVGKKVADFPTQEDFSTPEAAYATMHRVWAAEGDGAFRRLSLRELAARLPVLPPKPLPPQQAERLFNAEVLEVHVHRGTNAVVFARMNMGGKEGIDLRWLRPEDGRWLNQGNDVTGTLEDARKRFIGCCAYLDAKNALASRPPVANPQEYLRPFVEFLRREAVEPQEFLLSALAKRRVVILGEVHHRPRYWDFSARLTCSPEFARHAGVIYLELPANDQPLMDRFLSALKYDPQPVIEMLRDMLWFGWPDQPMLDFFKAVWETNQPLPKEQRLRIMLVDMARPWKDIQQRKDWNKFEVDREQFMAENILRDQREHAADPRHALFIVGYGHAMLNLARPGGEPMKSAGWHLREELGDTNILAVFPHSPVMSNNGQVGGRLALGLFENVFAVLTNRPMAFPLDRGPFGEQVFDASMDELTADPFRQGYHAYLYLGPLEDEVFSPLIPVFYTDEFVKELDRRSRMMSGKGLVEAEGIKRADAASFIEFMSQSWGQPRHEWAALQLGPLNAWELGSDWEKKMATAKLKNWTKETVAIRQAAARLFEAIRNANYENPGDWRSFPAPDVEYRVFTDAPAWVGWICQHFRTNPIVVVDLGELRTQTNGSPAIAYKVKLTDGSVLAGVLPIEWHARGGMWYGVEGLDWHLQESSSGPAESEQTTSPQARALVAKRRMINLVEDFFRHNYRDLTYREPLEWGSVTTSRAGESSIRYKYRAQVWGKTTITNNQVFRFDQQGKFISVENAP